MIELAEKTLTVERKKGSWIEGRYVGTADSSFEIKCSVQPIRTKIKDTVAEPGHKRTQNGIRIYTETKLNINDEKNQTPADIVLYASKRYEIQSQEDWRETDIPHFRYEAVELNGDGGGE